MNDAITFEVRGMNPAPQGSKEYVGHRKNGTAILKEANKNLPEWRDLVSIAAISLDAEMIKTAVSMSIVFVIKRPKSHFTSKGILKNTAPKYVTAKPDRDKLLRAVSDALTGILYKDDSWIVDGQTSKRYCIGDEEPGAIITLIPLY